MDGKDTQDPLHILTTVSLQPDEVRARLRNNIPISDQQSLQENNQSSSQQIVLSKTTTNHQHSLLCAPSAHKNIIDTESPHIQVSLLHQYCHVTNAGPTMDDQQVPSSKKSGGRPSRKQRQSEGILACYAPITLEDSSTTNVHTTSPNTAHSVKVEPSGNNNNNSDPSSDSHESQPTSPDLFSDKSGVMLDRKLLLTMSSKHFEDYVKKLSSSGCLTPQEEKQLKQQRRLISNRESAQASRKRKKAYVEDMESSLKDVSLKVTQLSANNAALSAQVTELIHDNKMLREQLEHEKKQRIDIERLHVATSSITTIANFSMQSLGAGLAVTTTTQQQGSGSITSTTSASVTIQPSSISVQANSVDHSLAPS